MGRFSLGLLLSCIFFMRFVAWCLRFVCVVFVFGIVFLVFWTFADCIYHQGSWEIARRGRRVRINYCQI